MTKTKAELLTEAINLLDLVWTHFTQKDLEIAEKIIDLKKRAAEPVDEIATSTEKPKEKVKEKPLPKENTKPIKTDKVVIKDSPKSISEKEGQYPWDKKTKNTEEKKTPPF